MEKRIIKTGIIGGAGYTAGELLRILLYHPQAEIVFVQSSSNAGNPVSDVHVDLLGDTDLRFTDALPLNEVDVIFLCMGHGKSKEFLEKNELPVNLKVVDLSHDFRLLREGNDFVYGLPELNREAIKKASKIANPGCFATGIQLALLPLVAANLLIDEVHVQAITGSTGAGQKPTETSHFSWRNGISMKEKFCKVLVSCNKVFPKDSILFPSEEITHAVFLFRPTLNLKARWKKQINCTGSFTKDIRLWF